MNDMTMMDEILVSVLDEIEEAKSIRPLEKLASMIDDMPKPKSLSNALMGEFGLIAEIKERAPSRGEMRRENVQQALAVYNERNIVKGISVLTNRAYFGMSVERLREVKLRTEKPVLRKEFIIDCYQVWEARAFGADAILLMVQSTSKDQLERLHDLACNLGMEVLVESHARNEVDMIPSAAKIFGVNTRNMLKSSSLYKRSRAVAAQSGDDLSVDLKMLENICHLPPDIIKIAESGMDPLIIKKVRDLGYHGALIGSDILLNKHGVDVALNHYEDALKND